MSGAIRGAAATSRSRSQQARRRGSPAAPRAAAWSALLAVAGAACASPTAPGATTATTTPSVPSAPSASAGVAPGDAATPPAGATRDGAAQATGDVLAAGPPPATCSLADAYFTARLRGAIEHEVRWRANDMTCEGMNRPDRRGLRVAFSGRAGREPLTFVLGIPRLGEGATGDDVPVNVTVIREGGGLYGTRGEDKCTLDHVRQTGLDVPPTTAKPRRWRIEARGFCLEPARNAADDGRDAILVATFDFAGHVTWEPDSTPAALAALATAAHTAH